MWIDLNGLWDFTADLDPKYHGAHGGYQSPQANRRHWLKAPVPGVWQKYGARYDIYQGVCWLAREFELPELPPQSRAQLHFGGVNYLCRVFLNGQEAGGHEGGYTPFIIEATGKLRPGSNHIAVMVDNRATTMQWPPVLGYFDYGGIHRGVGLEILCGPSLEEVRLHSVRGENGWELAVTGRTRNAEPENILRVNVGEGTSWEDRLPADGTIDTRVPCFDVPDWSPQDPHLEPVSVELLDEARRVVDRKDFRFGFRTIEMAGGAVRLNGLPCRLQGVCYVYDSPSTGLVVTAEQIETDLRLMKDLGCNAVRCHYPMDETFYAACDRLGLLVWIEPPVYCYHPGDKETGTRFADERWLALAVAMAREMISAARNHPSVAIYGIGNECNAANPEAEGFFRRLADVVRGEDPTRLISYAALYGNVGPLARIVDVLGINSYYGWYDQITQDGSDAMRPAGAAGSPRPIDLSALRQMLTKLLTGYPDVALLLTEFGADSVPGFLSAGRDLWSENYHADLLREIFAVAKGSSRIVGTFPFCFSDYRDPSKIPNGYWNELNLKGLVDYGRRKKLAYHAVQEAYRAGDRPEKE